MNTETINHLAAAGDKARDVGAGLGVFGWLLSSQFVGLAGLVVALFGVLVGWHYKREANRRQIAEHELRMEQMRRGKHLESDWGDMGAEE